MSNLQIEPEAGKEMTTDWREARRSARHQRRELRHNSAIGGWISGATLIIIGLAFMLKNVLDWSLPDSWWALFLLIPAITSLATAGQLFQSHEPRQRRAAFGALIGGSTMLIMAAALFFNINWQVIWPLILIAIGISIVISRSGTIDRTA